MGQVWLLLKGAQQTAQAIPVAAQLFEATGTISVKARLDHQSYDALQSAQMGTQLSYRILRSEGYLTQSMMVRYRLDDAPDNIIGHSAGLAFALAFATKALHRQRFKSLAATGTLEKKGRIVQVEGFVEKLQAALDTLPPESQLIYPEANQHEIDTAFLQRAHAAQVELIAVNSLEEALAKLGINLKKVYTHDPYRGLEAFQFEHSGTFFGRSGEVRALCDQLNVRTDSGHSSVLVLGGSGSGKSSFVLAGVLPELVYGTAWPSNVQVRWSVFRPRDAQSLQNNPLSRQPELERLFQVVKRSWNPPLLSNDVVSQQQTWDAEALINWLTKAVTSYPKAATIQETRFVWVIDQLEELFTLGFQADTVHQFSEFLVKLAEKGIWIILTLRSDYYPYYQNQPFLVNHFHKNGTFDLLPIRGEAIEQIIREPAWVSDCEFERDANNVSLATRIQNDAGKGPGVLPLLEFTLTELYMRRDKPSDARDTFTYQAYETINGLKGSIGHNAERLFQGLDESSQNALPSLIRALSAVAQEGPGITARTVLLEIYAEGTPKRAIIDQMTAARLLIKEGNENTQTQIRVAHEALLTHWPRAKQQIDNERPDLQLIQRLEQEAARWGDADKNDKPSLLLNAGNPLTQADDLISRLRDDLSDVVVGYIEASKQANEQRLDTENRQRKRRIQMLQLGLLLLSLLTGTAVWMAWQAEKAALHAKQSEKTSLEQSEVAMAQKLAMQATQVMQTDIVKGTLLAIESLRRTQTVEGYLAWAKAMKLLPKQVTRLVHEGVVDDFDFSSDGKHLATTVNIDGGLLGSTQVWDVKTGKSLVGLGNHGGVIQLAFSRDGELLVTTNFDGSIRVLDMTTRKEKYRVTSDGQRSYTPVFDPNGQYLAFTNHKSVSLVDAQTGRSIGSLPDKTEVIGFNSTGEFLLTGPKNKEVRVWSVETKKVHATLVHPDRVLNATISFDGKRLVTTSKDEIVRVWNINTGEMITKLAHDNLVYAMNVDDKGKRVATVNKEGLIRFWDVFDGKELTHFGLVGSLMDLVFSKDGKYMAAKITHYDLLNQIDSGFFLDFSIFPSEVILWDIEQGKILHHFKHTEGRISAMRFNPDNNQLLTASYNGDIRFWDIRTGKLIKTINHKSSINTLALLELSPDGRYLITGENKFIASRPPNYVQIWDIKKNKKVNRFGWQSSMITDISFSSQGRQIATSGFDGTARIWDTTTGAELARLEHNGRIKSLAFTADDRQVTIGSDSFGKAKYLYDPYDVNQAHLWSWEEDRLVSRLMDNGGVYQLEVSSDRKTVVTSGTDNMIRVWNTETGHQITKNWPNHDWVYFCLSAGGQALAIGDSRNFTILIKALDNDKVLAYLEHDQTVHDFTLSPDSQKLASLVPKLNQIWLWDVKTATVIARIKTPSLSFSEGSIIRYWHRSQLLFSPDTSLLAFIKDSSVLLWDTISGRQVLKLEHNGAIRLIDFEKESRFVLTLASDRGQSDTVRDTVYIWDLKNGEEIMVVSHKQQILSVKLSPDSTLLAIATSKCLEIWDVKKKKLIHTINHEYEVYRQGEMAIDFSASGKRLATGGGDLTVRIWNVDTGLEIARLPHSNNVKKVKFLVDESLLMTWDYSQVARVWHIHKETEQYQFSHGGAIVDIVHPDRSGRALTADGSIVNVWDTSTGLKIAKFQHVGNHRSMALSSDGNQLVSIVSSAGSHKSFANVWDVNTQQKMFQLVHDGSINQVIFSADNHRILTVSFDKTVRLWDSQSGREIVRIPHNNILEYVVLSNDGSLIAIEVNSRINGQEREEVHIWSVHNQSLIARIHTNKNVRKSKVAFIPDSRFLVIADGNKIIRIIDPWSAQSEHYINLARDALLHHMVMSPDGKHVAIVMSKLLKNHTGASVHVVNDGQVIILDLSNEKQIKLDTAHPIGSIMFSPDGTRVLTVDKGVARIWDANSGKELDHLQVDNGDKLYKTFALYNPNGTQIATMTHNGKVRIFTSHFKQPIYLAKDSIVSGITFNPEGTRLATIEGRYKQVKGKDGFLNRSDSIGFYGVRLWDTTTGEELLRLPHVRYASFSPNGKVLATGGIPNRRDAIQLWDTTTGERLALLRVSSLDPIYSGDSIRFDSFSPDGQFLTAAISNLLLIFDLKTGEEVMRLNQKKDVRDAVFTHDGHHIAVANGDNISIWDWQRGQEIARLHYDDLLLPGFNRSISPGFAFTPDDSKMVALTTSFRTVQLSEWRRSDLIKDACARLERNLTKQEWGLYMGNIKYRPTCPDIPVVN